MTKPFAFETQKDNYFIIHRIFFSLLFTLNHIYTKVIFVFIFYPLYNNR